MSRAVLVVDDSEIARAYLIDILASLGFDNVSEAEDGAQGVEMFTSTSPDIVFLDIEMPVMNGINVVRKIGPIKGRAMIIMMTSIGSMDVIDDCLLAGADDYLRKDLDETDITKRIKEIVG